MKVAVLAAFGTPLQVFNIADALITCQQCAFPRSKWMDPHVPQCMARLDCHRRGSRKALNLIAIPMVPLSGVLVDRFGAKRVVLLFQLLQGAHGQIW